MAIKRKSGKRRSNQSGLISGILIGLLVVGGLGGLGFAGYQIYKRVIVPALAEQRAKKLRDEFAAAEGRPAVPAGWRLLSQGPIQMLVPDSAKVPSNLPKVNQSGAMMLALYIGSADGVEIGISKITEGGSLARLGGRTLFDDMIDNVNPENLQGKMKTKAKVIYVRQLEGAARCLETLYEKNGSTELVRMYEDGHNAVLVVGVVGDPQSARFQEVVRSMNYRTSTPQAAGSTPVAATGASISAQRLDVLALINTQQHRIAGDWSRRGSEVMSPVLVAAMLELPFQATPSYEMEIEVERVGANVESFNIAFPIDGNWGMVVLDAYNGAASGLNLVNGQKAILNPDRYQSPVFRSGKNQIKLRVTPKTVVVEVNGTTIVNWTGDPTTLSIEYYWKAGEGKAFLGTWNAEYIVSRIDVRSL